MPGCCCRPCQHDRGGPGGQHPPGHQLPGLPPQEELAECPGTLYKEHHGKSGATLLAKKIYIFCGCTLHFVSMKCLIFQPWIWQAGMWMWRCEYSGNIKWWSLAVVTAKSGVKIFWPSFLLLDHTAKRPLTLWLCGFILDCTQVSLKLVFDLLTITKNTTWPLIVLAVTTEVYGMTTPCTLLNFNGCLVQESAEPQWVTGAGLAEFWTSVSTWHV